MTTGVEHEHRPSWSLPPEDVLADLGTDGDAGLSEDRARQLLRLGRNELPRPTDPSVFALIAGQLRETMILVLLGAAVLTAAVRDFADTAIIALVVLLNTGLGVGQQLKAQRAISALARLSAPRAHVVRSGTSRVLPAEEVVVGDLLEVQAGDMVPADGRLVDADGLEADEAVLTGESQPVRKHLASSPAEAPVAERHCMLLAGTIVTRGRGRVVVTATGSRSELGRLAHLLATTASPATPLQRRLARFGRQVAATVVLLCLLVLAIGLLRGEPLETMVLTAISLAVAAVPESLPAVVVLSLALAAQRMARRDAVVRTLPAVETLGAVTVVATDKTGTLTEGLMSATRVWTPAGIVTVEGTGYAPSGRLLGPKAAVGALGPLLEAVVLCNDARVVLDAGRWRAVGDPMEGALLALAARGGIEPQSLRQQRPRVGAFPFDHERARMTTVHPLREGWAACCKGAPEVLLRLVVQDEATRRAAEVVDQMTRSGLRVLAVATSTCAAAPTSAGNAESDLRLLGLVGLQDPPRAEATAAVAGCLAAGIVPLMITGDHPATAAAVGRQIGLLHDGELVLTGAEVAAGLSREQLERTRVFARTAPEQKLQIVDALRDMGHVVAMTGDGVNDAPALRAADVGVAMGRGGTEVARQAADLVLADDNFASVVAAVEEGRRVYDNVRRFLLYGLSGGLAEVLLMLGGPLVGLPLPLLPGQILWVNMLTHGLPGVALGAEQAESGALRRMPRNPAEGVLGGGLLRGVLALGTVVAAVCLTLGVLAQQSGHPWQTMVFVSLTLQQLGVVLVLRSQHRSLVRVGLRGNPLLLGAVALNGFLLWLAVAWSPLAGLLGTEALTAGEAGICVLSLLPAALAVEGTKALRRR